MQSAKRRSVIWHIYQMASDICPIEHFITESTKSQCPIGATLTKTPQQNDRHPRAYSSQNTLCLLYPNDTTLVELFSLSSKELHV